MFHLVKHWKLIILVINVIIFSLSAFASAEPLNDAAKERDLDEVKRLIEKGANVNVNCTDGYTPLHRASLLFGGDKEMVNFLIANGANVNAADEMEGTPLHWVAHMGLTEISEILIENGANVNAVVKNGTTPLMQTEMSGVKALMELLIKHGGHK